MPIRWTKTASEAWSRPFSTSFPHTTLWSFLRSDYVLVGSAAPPPSGSRRLRREWPTRPCRRDLARAGIRTVPDFLGNLVTGPAGCRGSRPGRRVHTDDNALLEFAAPRAMLDPEGKFRILRAIETVRDADFTFFAAEDALPVRWSPRRATSVRAAT